VKRRAFVKASATLGVGLVVGFRFDALLAQDAAKPALPNPFDAWIRIDASGDVTLICGKSEMGQGIHTALTQILADEVEVDWARVRVEQAATNGAFYDHGTGGSSSVRGSYKTLRQAAATARTQLVATAAEQWKVPAAECRAERSEVLHVPSGRRLGYGALATPAALRPLPDPASIVLKDAKDFRIIGQSIPRNDIPAKVDGSARYGLDVRVPGMLFAVIARCPTFGGTLQSFDAAKAKASPGVVAVFEVPPGPKGSFAPGGVAVVARSTWQALQGRNALTVQWNPGPHAGESSATLRKTFEQLTGAPSTAFRNDGDAAAAFAAAPLKLEATYELPFQAHASMEPLNATVDVRADRATAWLATQDPKWAQDLIMEVTGLKAEAVTVHTTYMGGGFGRRASADYIVEGAQVSKLAGAPVQVVWTREDDMQQGSYRPAAMHRFSAALDASGKPVAWLDRMSSVSISRQWDDPAKAKPWASEIDGAVNLPYAIPNLRMEYVDAPSGVPRMWWRSVEHSINGFAIESFVDELAAAAKQDPLAFRLALLAEPRLVKSPNDPDGTPLDTKRLKACLELAASKAGWGTPLPKGRARGLACHFSFQSYAAQVAEVSLANGAPRVHRIVSAVDCGRAINPDGVVAQVESSVVYALSAALKGSITIAKGGVEQSNFHDFEVLRLPEMPVVEVHIVPSDEAPTGIGEPGLPPVASAVGNALFALTGKRVRHLPIRAADLA
jgi:isoquinoline 1-oxidoreductase beta subunit